MCGQLAAHATEEATRNDDVGTQTRRALKQVAAVLSAGGATWDDVLMVRVHLADDDDFEAMDAAYSETLTAPFPPRTTVTAGLPPGALVEIDALAVVD